MDSETESNWRLVSSGLLLKLIALAEFLCALLVTVAGAGVGLPTLWIVVLAAPIVGVSAVADYVGRALCLRAPSRDRSLIRGSMACQAVGFAALGALTLWDPQCGGMIGLGTLVAFQLAAAVLFTRFLHQTARELGDGLAVRSATALRKWLVTSVVLGIGATGYTVVIVFVALLVTVVTCGAGMILLPLWVALLIPPIGLVVARVVVVYTTYTMALLQLRRAVLVRLNRIQRGVPQPLKRDAGTESTIPGANEHI